MPIKNQQPTIITHQSILHAHPVKTSPAILDRLKTELAAAYHHARAAPSGKLIVDSLKVSTVPARWKLEFITSRGNPYLGAFRGEYTTDLTINAVISPQWIEQPMVNHTTQGIVAGYEFLPCPNHLDVVRIRHCWSTHGNRLELRYSPVIEYRVGDIIYHESFKPAHTINRRTFLAHLPKTLTLGHAVMRKHIAKSIANRFTR